VTEPVLAAGSQGSAGPPIFADPAFALGPARPRRPPIVVEKVFSTGRTETWIKTCHHFLIHMFSA